MHKINQMKKKTKKLSKNILCRCWSEVKSHADVAQWSGMCDLLALNICVNVWKMWGTHRIFGAHSESRNTYTYIHVCVCVVAPRRRAHHTQTLATTSLVVGCQNKRSCAENELIFHFHYNAPTSKQFSISTWLCEI